MIVAERKDELRAELDRHRAAGRTIGLVPTMGYLHAGHAALIDASSARCEVTVATIFVNPMQFGPDEDFDRYPRDLQRDLDIAREHGAGLVYAPEPGEVYPDGFATAVEVQGLTEVLCGAPSSRGREHFKGVTTVVAKLLNTVRPDVAFFGQKDAQQAIVIRRMVRDLDFGIEVVTVPTVREVDGLALSSRNAYLSDEDRRRAPALSRGLREARDALLAGEAVGDALARAERHLEEAGISPEYLEARDAEDLSRVSSLNGRPVLVAVAADVGTTRLIDNVLVDPAGGPD